MHIENHSVQKIFWIKWKSSNQSTYEGATDGNAYVILAYFDASKLVFDDGYWSSLVENKCYMSMEKKSLKEIAKERKYNMRCILIAIWWKGWYGVTLYNF